jgi:hypothetical protein
MAEEPEVGEPQTEKAREEKQEGSILGGLLALAGGLWVAWRVWSWRYPSEAVEAWKHAQGPDAGTGILVPLALAAWWTFVAFIGGALVGHFLWRFLAFLGRAFAEGFRRGHQG